MPPTRPPFPTRRSSDLSSSRMCSKSWFSSLNSWPEYLPKRIFSPTLTPIGISFPLSSVLPGPQATTSPTDGFSAAVSGMTMPDRKSTRLNSSHITTSYATDPTTFPYTTLFRSVVFAHVQQVLVFQFEFLARVFAEEDLFADLDAHRDQLSVVVGLAGAAGHDFADRRLFSRSVGDDDARSEEHTSELQSHHDLVCHRPDHLSLHDALPICRLRACAASPGFPV